MTPIYESDVEKLCIELLEEQGYRYLSPEDQETERGELSEVILKDRLRHAIDSLNPGIPSDALEYAYKLVINLATQNLV
ncbi:MAG: hypothetical protein CO098_17605, partial [Bacteroidetes bacterium CG_4_9_14_3_um_filter_41_19]